MGSVALINVSKVFNEGTNEEVKAVDNVSLDIRDGEFIVLVGPSGCGKSTSLRMVAGLERPTSGQILIGERDVTHLHPRARNIAMVFQDYALYPHMSVKQNLSFGLQNLKYPKDEIARRVEEASRMLGIQNLLDRQPKKLSGGQRQRVALGRAIVRNPEVFLLDEPLSNLDAKLRVQMRVELAELQRRLGTTMIYVTHDQEEAMTLGHRIVVMRNGVIQQVATPEELYAKPGNVFVANFIGSPAMNLISGTVSQAGEGMVFRSREGEFKVKLPDRLQPGLGPYVGKPVYMGLRPEHIRIETGEGSPDSLSASVEVSVTEMLGPERLVYFYVGGQLIVASIDPDVRVQATETVRVTWSAERLHFFDGETEERIKLEGMKV